MVCLVKVKGMDKTTNSAYLFNINLDPAVAHDFTLATLPLLAVVTLIESTHN